MINIDFQKRVNFLCNLVLNKEHPDTYRFLTDSFFFYTQRQEQLQDGLFAKTKMPKDRERNKEGTNLRELDKQQQTHRNYLRRT